MRPIRTPDTDLVFKLRGGTEENDLPAERVETPEGPGAAAVVTVWDLDSEERAAVAAGAMIRLTIFDGLIPPVALGVEDRPASASAKAT